MRSERLQTGLRRVLVVSLILDLFGGLLFRSIQEQHAEDLGLPRSWIGFAFAGKSLALGGALAAPAGSSARVCSYGAVAAHGAWAGRLMATHGEMGPAAYPVAQGAAAGVLAVTEARIA